MIDVGSAAANSDGTLFFQEEVSTYKDASTAAQAFQFGEQGISCTQGTTSDGSTFTISQPKDASSTLGVSGAVEVDVQGPDFTSQLFAVTQGNAIVVFQFQGAPNADTSSIPSPESLARDGLARLGFS